MQTEITSDHEDYFDGFEELFNPIEEAIIDILKKYSCSINFFDDICKDMTFNVTKNNPREWNTDWTYFPFHNRSCDRIVTKKVTKKQQSADLENCKNELLVIMKKHGVRFSHYEVNYEILLNHIGGMNTFLR